MNEPNAKVRVQARTEARKNAKTRARACYEEMVETYRRKAPGMNNRRVIVDGIVLIIELGAPIALGYVLVLLGATLPSAAALAVALLVILTSPRVSPGGHQSSIKSTAPFLAGIATLGSALLLASRESSEPYYRMLDSLKFSHSILDSFQLDQPILKEAVVRSVLILTTTTAALGLAAIILIHVLRRHRRSLIWWFLAHDRRTELVCELVQIIQLLNQMSEEMRNKKTRQMELIQEKISRVRYIFRTGGESPRLQGVGGLQKLQRTREVSGSLKAALKQVPDGEAARQRICPPLSILAAKLLLGCGGNELSLKIERSRAAIARQRRDALIGIARAILGLTAPIVLLLLFRSLGFSPPAVLTSMAYMEGYSAR